MPTSGESNRYLMSYTNTFIRIATDSTTEKAVVPTAKGDKKPQHLIQYELLTERPYAYNHDELTFEVYVRHKGISPAEVAAHHQELWDELLQKGHPCMRASALTKKYGWGAHYDAEGKIALYGCETPEYQHFLDAATQAGSNLKVLNAMRSKRA